MELKIKTKKVDKIYNCDICGKPVKFPDHMYVGGYLRFAHPECAKYAEAAIDRYLHWILLDHVGILQLSRDILETRESIEKQTKRMIE